jgi:hypothetical protein
MFTNILEEYIASILTFQDKRYANEAASKKMAISRNIFLQDNSELVPDCTTS